MFAARVDAGVHGPLIDSKVDVIAGWALARHGDPEAGLARVVLGRGRATAIGDRMHATWALALQAEILLDLDRPDDALAVIGEGMSLRAVTHEALWLPELHRLRGDAWDRLGAPVDQVLTAYDTARTLALDQDAVAFVRRAERSTAAALARDGRASTSATGRATNRSR
jgi:hypothetical protein